MDRYEWIGKDGDHNVIERELGKAVIWSLSTADLDEFAEELLRLAALVEEQRAEIEHLKTALAENRQLRLADTVVFDWKMRESERENERLERERLEDLRSLSMAMGNPALNWTPPQTIDGALMSFACRRLEEATETVNELAHAERALADAVRERDEARQVSISPSPGGGALLVWHIGGRYLEAEVPSDSEEGVIEWMFERGPNDFIHWNGGSLNEAVARALAERSGT